MLDRARARSEVRPLLEELEGVRLSAYRCSAGFWTAGVGHRVPKPVVITKEQAQAWLTEDIMTAEKAIGENVIARLNTNQLMAVISFVFNIGGRKWLTSTMRAKILAGDMTGASAEFPRWNKEMKPGATMLTVSRGLTYRRHAERTLFDCVRGLN